jgi:aryl-alcohol dehydrogenase-like predicted oxidoreductase
MKLGLGTVAFGLDYGVANRDGQVSPDEAARILALAAESGIRVIDTAHLYGDSERVLGRAVSATAGFRLITKTPRFGHEPLTAADADALEVAAEGSRRALRCDRLAGLLLHHAPDALALGAEHLFDRLARLQERGWVEKVGVSVYNPAELEQVLERHPTRIDLVQVPFNVLDQRLAQRPSLLRRLRAESVEVHARSAFLQGLLLMDPDQVAPYFAPWRSTLAAVREQADAAGMSPLALALRFAADAPFIDAVVVGATTRAQLAEIVDAARTTAPLPGAALASLAIDDEALINPSRWPPPPT